MFRFELLPELPADFKVKKKSMFRGLRLAVASRRPRNMQKKGTAEAAGIMPRKTAESRGRTPGAPKKRPGDELHAKVVRKPAGALADLTLPLSFTPRGVYNARAMLLRQTLRLRHTDLSPGSATLPSRTGGLATKLSEFGFSPTNRYKPHRGFSRGFSLLTWSVGRDRTSDRGPAAWPSAGPPSKARDGRRGRQYVAEDRGAGGGPPGAPGASSTERRHGWPGFQPSCRAVQDHRLRLRPPDRCRHGG